MLQPNSLPSGALFTMNYSFLDSRVEFLARMFMIEDGMLCTISRLPGWLEKSLVNMSPADARKAKRRFRKAWRMADKKRYLNVTDPKPEYRQFGLAVPEHIKFKRAKVVNTHYIEKARAILVDKAA